MLFFEEIQRQLDELQQEENCEVITEGDFNTLNPNTPGHICVKNTVHALTICFLFYFSHNLLDIYT